MPRTPLPAEYLDALRQPNKCVVATIRPNGELSTAATWYELVDDQHILLNLDATRARMKHMRADPHVALTIFATDDWYSHVSVSGEVVEFREDEGMVDIDRIAEHYTGRPYADRERDSQSVLIRITSWHAWNMPKVAG
ncbi:pyridoxamine 5'-phosphate oxidase family protein [Microbacterium halophytorum]|uniref:pyridoxamine 5'-phosphate oxidase family protein n=1 Tax=Microbacterium halophytorum TaxID=2067568 RepID=UPI000CFD0D4C|nr:pyridoxamine 5'-phosphate oxidase family protein [Microbacterium halophytorum]